MTSIYGPKFSDENFDLKHSEAGILSMAKLDSLLISITSNFFSAGPDTNGCQFFITCAQCDFLDGKHVVFGMFSTISFLYLDALGRVLDGLLTVRKIENVPTAGSNGKPKMPIVIEQCGEL